jgi:hypothetical protein
MQGGRCAENTKLQLYVNYSHKAKSRLICNINCCQLVILERKFNQVDVQVRLIDVNWFLYRYRTVKLIFLLRFISFILFPLSQTFLKKLVAIQINRRQWRLIFITKTEVYDAHWYVSSIDFISRMQFYWYFIMVKFNHNQMRMYLQRHQYIVYFIIGAKQSINLNSFISQHN